jgi:dihydroxyacetone synthase
MTGDACLQEGVGLEAISLAGHLRLNNLTLIYDNNQVTCDGLVSLTNTEDVNKKMEACGWNVVDIEDGCFDIPRIVIALQESKQSTRPTFINVRTIIGVGSAVAGNAVAHGAAFGTKDVAAMKKAYGFNSEENFIIPDVVREFFQDLPSKGDTLVAEWEYLFSKYSSAHPDLAAEFVAREMGDLPSDWESLIPSTFPNKPTASRASSGLVFNPLAEKLPQFMVGTADLSPSVHMNWKGSVTFEPPHLDTGNYTGRYIHYGIREHAMAAVANGIAAFHPNMIIPVTSS